MDCSVVVNPSSVPSQPSFPSSSVISLNDPSHTRNLVGSTVASAQLLQDLDGHSRTFFIFPDLAVRTEGQFTLRFIFTSLLSGSNSRDTSADCHVFSESFEVYSAKKFPGMTDSTDLSRCFADQGIKIPIRKKGGSK
ncbi:velvet factor-domain-containing protein [Dimargaris cristalligena]|uniref:Velvet factor-domain-containing protein n=1 Tax=Dimargaris cristalligena TaxID=215637 RepID=A0A4P9ZNP9_9FUNG|nr:velvet factor-domain-containing protein [Dimargaris cristalligena]|eukprot:RKP34967.1 velvet factor-domain-containing protein [Dimargaris cristalligena]